MKSMFLKIGSTVFAAGAAATLYYIKKDHEKVPFMERIKHTFPIDITNECRSECEGIKPQVPDLPLKDLLNFPPWNEEEEKKKKGDIKRARKLYNINKARHDFRYTHTLDAVEIMPIDGGRLPTTQALLRSHTKRQEIIGKCLGNTRYGVTPIHHVILLPIGSIEDQLKLKKNWGDDLKPPAQIWGYTREKQMKYEADMKDYLEQKWRTEEPYFLADDHKEFVWIPMMVDVLTFVWDQTDYSYRIYIYSGYVLIHVKEDESGWTCLPHRIVFINDELEPLLAYVTDIVDHFDEDFLIWQKSVKFVY